MAGRQLVKTDADLQSGQPVPRAYIAQIDEEFSQIIANLIGAMENIINNPDAPATAKVNATREMRFLIEAQLKLLDSIESRQNRQEMESQTNDIRKMVRSNPYKALAVLDDRMKKLLEFREFVADIAERDPIAQMRSAGLPSLPDGETPF